jgi:protein SCO1/2
MHLATGIAATLVAATLFVTSGQAVAGEHDHHHMAPEAPVPDEAESPPIRVPDVSVVTQEGRKVSFYRDLVKGRVVVVNFIYTTCTAICSPMTANLHEVQRLLEPEYAKRVHFISITIDPKTDTPAVLKTFAEQFKIDGNWTFVTASAKNQAKLQKGFAVSMARKEDHTPLVLIGNDKTGQWTRKLGIANPMAIAEAIRQTAGQAD